MISTSAAELSRSLYSKVKAAKAMTQCDDQAFASIPVTHYLKGQGRVSVFNRADDHVPGYHMAKVLSTEKQM